LSRDYFKYILYSLQITAEGIENYSFLIHNLESDSSCKPVNKNSVNTDIFKVLQVRGKA